ncbi:hypothetical protein C8R46DRAFT_1024564 [Mycena filopes]|nr:hypothetical protein C8R46DRAFT_1024564 [Mycena filopes]
MAVLLNFEKPRPKRTSDEVAAADAERAAAAEALARAREEAMALIASIDVKLDAAKAAEANAIDDVDDLPADAMEEDDLPELTPEPEDEQMLIITQEDFDRIEDDDAYLSASEWDKPQTTKAKGKAAAPAKRTRKPGKGETRQEIEALGKKLAASAKTTAVKKRVQNSDAAAASTKAGLSKSWAAAASNHSSTVGGFTDEDVEGTRPDFEATETMVGLVGLSDDQDTPSKVPGRPAPIKAVHAPVKVEADTSKIPALAVRARKSKTVAKTESLSSSYLPFTPPSSADVKGLPAFIVKTWKTKFLPRVYLVLYMSHDPMALGVVGNDPNDPGRATIDIFQHILDELYPEVKWSLKWDDPICSKAVCRLREERARFAKRGMGYADDEFQNKKYFNGNGLRLSTLIASDAKYAVRSNGPAFYKVPTPQAVGLLRSDNPAYINPRGYFESAAVIHTVSPVVGKGEWALRVYKDENNKDKVDLSGLPVGALGLAAAGVERGYKLHVTGIRAKPLDFSADNFGTAVDGWIEGIKGLRASHWQSIIAACGAAVTADLKEEEEEPDSEVEEETLDGVRERMYIPSSSPCRDESKH